MPLFLLHTGSTIIPNFNLCMITGINKPSQGVIDIQMKEGLNGVPLKSVISKILAKSVKYQSRTNGPINAHLTIAQVMPRYKHKK